MGAVKLDKRFKAALAALAACLLPWSAAADRALTLDQALALARENSPGLGQARARLDEAEADYVTARAAFFPRVFGSAYLWRLNTDRLGPLGGQVGATGAAGAPALYGQEAFAGVRVKQPLFDGMRMWRGRAFAAQGVAAEELGVAAAGAEVELATTLAFIRLVEAQQLVAVTQRSLARQRSFEALVEAQLEIGRGSRLDQAKARAQRLDAERLLVAAQESAQVAEAALRRSIGLEPGEALRAAGELPGLEPAGEEQVLVARAEQRNPELLRLGEQLSQAGESVGVARAGFYPELSLQGAYGYRDRDVGGGAREWSAGVFLDWSLFEGGATLGQVRKAQARVRQLQEARRAAVLQLRLDVRDALAAWRTALAAAESTREAVEASRTALEAATALFEAGRATGLDVLTAQAELLRGEAVHVQAVGDVTIARARLTRLTGG